MLLLTKLLLERSLCVTCGILIDLDYGLQIMQFNPSQKGRDLVMGKGTCLICTCSIFELLNRFLLPLQFAQGPFLR